MVPIYAPRVLLMSSSIIIEYISSIYQVCIEHISSISRVCIEDTSSVSSVAFLGGIYLGYTREILDIYSIYTRYILAIFPMSGVVFWVEYILGIYSIYTRFILAVYSIIACFFPRKTHEVLSINRVYIEYISSIWQVYMLTEKQRRTSSNIPEKYSKYTREYPRYILGIYSHTGINLVYPEYILMAPVS